MPGRFASICVCGKRVASGEVCPCRKQAKREHDRRRPTARQRGYNTDWQHARKAYLAENPTCRMPNCSEPATVVDHIQRHRGNKALFWNRANWQPLCARCHNRRKQALERRCEEVQP